MSASFSVDQCVRTRVSRVQSLRSFALSQSVFRSPAAAVQQRTCSAPFFTSACIEKPRANLARGGQPRLVGKTQCRPGAGPRGGAGSRQQRQLTLRHHESGLRAYSSTSRPALASPCSTYAAFRDPASWAKKAASPTVTTSSPRATAFERPVMGLEPRPGGGESGNSLALAGGRFAAAHALRAGISPSQSGSLDDVAVSFLDCGVTYLPRHAAGDAEWSLAEGERHKRGRTPAALGDAEPRRNRPSVCVAALASGPRGRLVTPPSGNRRGQPFAPLDRYGSGAACRAVILRGRLRSIRRRCTVGSQNCQESALGRVGSEFYAEHRLGN